MSTPMNSSAPQLRSAWVVVWVRSEYLFVIQPKIDHILSFFIGLPKVRNAAQSVISNVFTEHSICSDLAFCFVHIIPVCHYLKLSSGMFDFLTLKYVISDWLHLHLQCPIPTPKTRRLAASSSVFLLCLYLNSYPEPSTSKLLPRPEPLYLVHTCFQLCPRARMISR